MKTMNELNESLRKFGRFLSGVFKLRTGEESEVWDEYSGPFLAVSIEPDEFDLAGLDIGDEDKDRLIAFCVGNDTSIDELISMLQSLEKPATIRGTQIEWPLIMQSAYDANMLDHGTPGLINKIKHSRNKISKQKFKPVSTPRVYRSQGR